MNCRRKRKSGLQNKPGFSNLKQLDNGWSMDQPQAPPKASYQKSPTSTDAPSSLGVNGALGTAAAVSLLMSEGMDKAGATGVDSVTDLPQYDEERRLMKVAIERMSSPGLGILTASSMSNAKMQALMSGGPGLLQQLWGQVLSRRYRVLYCRYRVLGFRAKVKNFTLNSICPAGRLVASQQRHWFRHRSEAM